MRRSYNRAIVLGGAKCVWDDLEQSRMLFEPDMVVTVNHIGIEYKERIDHWVSYHGDMLANWADERDLKNMHPASRLWTGPVIPRYTRKMTCFECRGGSSGFLGVMIALNMGATHVVLCGVPMDPDMTHFHNRNHNREWSDGKNYHQHWIDKKTDIQGIVKSMSGWTKKLLGAPTREWLKS